jgi:hypothetical protein
MVASKRIPTPDEFLLAMRTLRGEAVALLRQAHDAGDMKEAKAYQTEITKLDKLLAKFGVKFDA